MNQLKTINNGYLLDGYPFPKRRNNFLGIPYQSPYPLSQTKNLLTRIFAHKVHHLDLENKYSELTSKITKISPGEIVCFLSTEPTKSIISNFGKLQNRNDLLEFGVLPTKGFSELLFIFKKLISVTVSKAKHLLYNPVIEVEKIKYKSKTFSLIDDGHLITGTKQRGVIDLIKRIPEKNIVYASPPQGFAQKAIAHACKMANKNFILYVSGYGQYYQIILEAFHLNPNLELNVKMVGISKLEEIIETKYRNDKNTFIFPFGGRFNGYIDLMSKNIAKVYNSDALKVKRIWLVGGSGTVLNSLYPIFPNATFHCIQVGRKIYDDVIDPDRTKMYMAKEKFAELAKDPPPYSSVPYYDAKLWSYVKQYGKTGDYIWNVS